MYAIQNIKTKKFVWSTDYRNIPYKQRTSKEQVLTYEWLRQAQIDFYHRRCGKAYRIVKLKQIEVEQIIEDEMKGDKINGSEWD